MNGEKERRRRSRSKKEKAVAHVASYAAADRTRES